ncbi:tetratricopeptide repeat protein [Reyranella sp.]|uniref:tetratricopeptide repeat protein n=1 Tax=Reyranella sp. TaxID=1929291 RepID=UPI002F95CAB7
MSEIGIVTSLPDRIADAWRKGLDLLIGRRLTISPRTREEEIFLRARNLARAGELQEAATTFGDAATAAPDLIAAFENQGELLDILGETEKARSLYEAGRILRQRLRGATPDRSFVLRRAGRSTAEIAAYTTVLQSVKQRVLPFIARGNAFLVEGRPEPALVDYEAALKLKPGLSDVLALKAEALLMMGRFEQAATTFDSACAVQPRNADFLSGRAIARLALRRLGDADADWRVQFELLPAERASARACVALRLADYGKALPELEHALAKEPCDPYWRLYRLTALGRLGRPAMPDAKPSLDSWPNPLLWLHAKGLSTEEVLARADNGERRAEALFQLGVLALPHDPAEARRRFTAIVDDAPPSMIEHAAARHELAGLGS